VTENEAGSNGPGATTDVRVACHRLDKMVGGWFVGAFEPTALHLDAAEVAVKHYRAGETEAVHVHRLATEVTLVLSGRARMCGREVGPGEILVLPPGVASGFHAITEVTTVVVKTPSAPGDKHVLASEQEGHL
jgi:mannose-6-phosphate isomerase-like protein (cupin superfamily)